jgi:hypothetical protein
VKTPVWYVRDIADGDTGSDVAVVQRKMGLLPTGHADPAFTLVVRGYQKGVRLPATGIVDDLTAVELGEQEGFGLLPVWWTGPVSPGEPHYQNTLDLIGATDTDGLKRFQGNHQLPPTGVVDETTARLLAGLEVELYG